MTTNDHGRRMIRRTATTMLMLLAAGCGFAANPYSFSTPSAYSEQVVAPIAPMHESAPRRRDVEPIDGCIWNGPMYGAANAALIGVGVGTRDYVRRLWALSGFGPPCALAASERRS